MKDLVLLVADKNMEYAIRGLLGRHQALGIRQIDWDLFVHPRHDPGCLNEAHDFLRPWTGQYQYALVLFDHQGCGQEEATPETVASQIEPRLAGNGWDNRARVIILAPELEVWVWSPSPYVDECLGWAGRQPALREWLAAHDFWPQDAPKPTDPKAALEAALRQVRKPRSSSIYLCLANKVSLGGHTNPAFLQFRQTLQRWFPQ